MWTNSHFEYDIEHDSKPCEPTATFSMTLSLNFFLPNMVNGVTIFEMWDGTEQIFNFQNFWRWQPFPITCHLMLGSVISDVSEKPSLFVCILAIIHNIVFMVCFQLIRLFLNWLVHLGRVVYATPTLCHPTLCHSTLCHPTLCHSTLCHCLIG